MSFTYTTLRQAIQDYTDNTETTFVNNLDTFITSAEERILKLVELNFFRKNVSANTLANNKYLAVPSDYLASFSLSIKDTNDNKQFLLMKDVNFIQEYWPDGTVTGFPRYYGLFDVDNFIIGPTPNAAFEAELHYFYRPQSITTSVTGESWLGTNAPNTLLYGCLTEAYVFMKGEPDIIQLYETRFAESASRLKNYSAGVEDTDAYRTGLVRTQKT